MPGPQTHLLTYLLIPSLAPSLPHSHSLTYLPTYFFPGLSTTGALLLLAQFGPGEIAVDKDELILGDVQRARD